jgi:hypothetical protein
MYAQHASSDDLGFLAELDRQTCRRFRIGLASHDRPLASQFALAADSLAQLNIINLNAVVAVKPTSQVGLANLALMFLPEVGSQFLSIFFGRQLNGSR